MAGAEFFFFVFFRFFFGFRFFFAFFVFFFGGFGFGLAGSGGVAGAESGNGAAASSESARTSDALAACVPRDAGRGRNGGRCASFAQGSARIGVPLSAGRQVCGQLRR